MTVWESPGPDIRPRGVTDEGTEARDLRGRVRRVLGSEQRHGAVADDRRRERQDGAGVRLRRRGPRARVHPAARRRPGLGRPARPHVDRAHAPEGHQRGPQGAGHHRPQPVLHDARPRQRGPADRRHRRRRPQRPLAPLLRQLLRPARLRLHPRGDERHRQLDRLPDARRPGRHREHEGRDRLAQRPPARLRQGRQPGHRAVAQRQGGDDRQVLRRDARQRRRRHRRRGPRPRSFRSRRSRSGTSTPARAASGTTTTTPATRCSRRSPTRIAATCAPTRAR